MAAETGSNPGAKLRLGASRPPGSLAEFQRWTKPWLGCEQICIAAPIIQWPGTAPAAFTTTAPEEVWCRSSLLERGRHESYSRTRVRVRGRPSTSFPSAPLLARLSVPDGRPPDDGHPTQAPISL